MRFLRKKSEAQANGELANMRSRMRERLPESGSLAELFAALAEDDKWDVERPKIGNTDPSDESSSGPPGRPAAGNR